jgi:hypothetical protein
MVLTLELWEVNGSHSGAIENIYEVINSVFSSLLEYFPLLQLPTSLPQQNFIFLVMFSLPHMSLTPFGPPFIFWLVFFSISTSHAFPSGYKFTVG